MDYPHGRGDNDRINQQREDIMKVRFIRYDLEWNTTDTWTLDTPLVSAHEVFEVGAQKVAEEMDDPEDPLPEMVKRIANGLEEMLEVVEVGQVLTSSIDGLRLTMIIL